jgi:hypothetical protein
MNNSTNENSQITIYDLLQVHFPAKVSIILNYLAFSVNLIVAKQKISENHNQNITTCDQQ